MLAVVIKGLGEGGVEGDTYQGVLGLLVVGHVAGLTFPGLVGSRGRIADGKLRWNLRGVRFSISRAGKAQANVPYRLGGYIST